MGDKAAPDREQQKLEVDITKRFVEVFSKKVDVLQKKYAQRPGDFVLEDKEKAIIMKLNNGGLMEGLLAGMASLFALRKLRGVVLKKAFERARQGGSSNPMQQQASQHHSQLPNSPFHKNPLEGSTNEAPPKPGVVVNVMGWAIDVVCSFFIAGTVSMYRFDVETIAKEVSQIPLFPGRSAVAYEFCPDAVNVLNQLREESKRDAATEKVLVDPNSEVFKAVINFAKNCERRSKHEEVLRKEKGVSKDYRVAIPEPGVPVGVEDDSDDPSSLTSGWADQDSFSLDGDNNSANWADEFVQDQEEDNRK